VLTGVGFDGNTQVEFIGSNGIPRAPTRVEQVSSTALNLFLPTMSWPPDVYSVRVTKGITSRTQANAFTLGGVGEAKLEVRIIGTALRPEGGQTLYLEYANVGTRSMPTPLLKVTAFNSGVVVVDKLNRRPQDRFTAVTGGGGYGARSVRLGYRFRVSMPLHTTQVMAIAPGPTPGILNPGERGVVPVYFDGLSEERGQNKVQFSVGSLTANDTSIIDLGPPAPGLFNEVYFPRHGRRLPGPVPEPVHHGFDAPFAPDWNALETSSLPETADSAGWHAVWQNVVSASGPLWADYVMMLGDNMNHLAKIDQISNDPAKLFNFEVLQSTGSLHPVRTLAGAVDASAPSSGFPLVFRRVFGQPILSRYKLGPLGRGWTHNWDISVQGLEQFQGAVVHGPNGADRFFGRYNDGTYTATDGDTGKLTFAGNVFRLTEADGTVWQFGSHGLKNALDYVEDPNGNRITCGYSGALLTSLTHTSGRQLILAYNGAGRLVSLTDPLAAGAGDDRITTYEYDGSGEHLVRVTAPGNRVTDYAYHTTGALARLHALTSVIHPDLTDDAFAYDDRGRLIQSSSSCCGGAQTVSYAYDSAGTITVTDATDRTTQLLYGLRGQLAQVRDGEGRVVNFGYDEISRLTQLRGPGGERYSYGYDDLGNLTRLEDPLRQPSDFTYEPTFNGSRKCGTRAATPFNTATTRAATSPASPIPATPPNASPTTPAATSPPPPIAAAMSSPTATTPPASSPPRITAPRPASPTLPTPTTPPATSPTRPPGIRSSPLTKPSTFPTSLSPTASPASTIRVGSSSPSTTTPPVAAPGAPIRTETSPTTSTTRSAGSTA
jgi:YD repeat-containing protein